METDNEGHFNSLGQTRGLPPPYHLQSDEFADNLIRTLNIAITFASTWTFMEFGKRIDNTIQPYH